MGNKIVLAVAVVALASVGCGQGPQHSKLQIRATAAALTGTQAGVASMSFELLGDGNGWSGVQGQLYNENADGSGHWSYTADLIPIGGVKLSAKAMDSHGVLIFETAGYLHVEILAHQVVTATLLLQDKRPQTVFDNTAPYITSLTATASQIDALTPITLEAKVTHPTGGAMTYAWTASAGGTLSAPAGLVTTWLPPGNGDFTLTFSATDDGGSMAALSVIIKVQSSFAKGGLAVLMDFNAWPVVTKVSTDGAEARAGVAMTVVALASDADGDQLTYSWAADCQPITASTSSITFTPLAAGHCALTVTVLDGRGGSNTGVLRFKVGAAAAAIGPQFYVRFVSPSEIYPGQKTEMQVMPLSGHSEAGWTYLWDYGIGPSRGLDGFTDGSDVWFTPPTCTAAMIATGVVTIPVSVLITDTATGAYNSATMPIKLHCNGAPGIGPAPVNLRTAGGFAILSKTGITDVYASAITGNVGTSPITGAALLLSCGEVTGQVFVVDAAGPLPCAINDATSLTAAVLDMETAYLDAEGRVSPDFTELGAGEIGGLTLRPGLYKWGTGLLITTDVTLSGGPNDVWIFQVAGTLNQANATRVTLAGGARPQNIFWQVAGSATIGTTAHFEGIVLGKTLIAANTGASVNGRLLAQTAVTLQMNTVTQPAQ